MGHIRNLQALALLAAVATGCVADTTAPTDKFTLNGAGPEDTFSCGLGSTYNEDTPSSRKGYHLYGCWLGDDPKAFELDCAKANDSYTFACVSDDMPGVWYSHEGGTKTQETFEYMGLTLYAITFTGGEFVEHDCDSVVARSPLLDTGWCED